MPATDRKLRVFLCHSSQDKPIVRELYQRLLAEGWIDPWLDEKKLRPGQDWETEIEKAVETTDAVIVLLSNISVKKEGYIQKELRFALSIALEKPEDSIFIVPLRLDDCFVPRSMKSIQYVNYFPDEQRELAYTRLCASLEDRANTIRIDIYGIKESIRQQIAEKAKKETEERIQKEAEEKIRLEEEDALRKRAEDHARKVLEKKLQKQAEEKTIREKEELELREAEEKARHEAGDSFREENVDEEVRSWGLDNDQRDLIVYTRPSALNRRVMAWYDLKKGPVLFIGNAIGFSLAIISLLFGSSYMQIAIYTLVLMGFGGLAAGYFSLNFTLKNMQDSYSIYSSKHYFVSNDSAGLLGAIAGFGSGIMLFLLDVPFFFSNTTRIFISLIGVVLSIALGSVVGYIFFGERQ